MPTPTAVDRPARTRRPRPRRRLPPEVLSAGEAVAIMDACGRDCPGLRNRALLAILYRAGLRISEALELRPKDLDLANGMVRVHFGKGGKSRTVGIDAGAVPIIEEWVLAREQWGVDARSPPANLTLVNGKLSKLRRRKEYLQQQVRAAEADEAALDEKALRRWATERLGLLPEMAAGRRDEKARQALASYVDEIMIDPETKSGTMVINAGLFGSAAEGEAAGSIGVLAPDRTAPQKQADPPPFGEAGRL